MADKRLQRSVISVLALNDFLKEICVNPESFIEDMYLHDALKSQGGISKYSNPGLGISPSSINTLKRVCAEAIDGGFKSLDELRKGALERIEQYEYREQTSNKRTRSGLMLRVDELEKQIIMLKQSNYLLTQAVYEVIADIQSVANIDDKAVRDSRSQDAIKKLSAMMSVKYIKPLLNHDISNVFLLKPKSCKTE